MPYYHVIIETDEGEGKEEHDLSKEELEKIVESYHENIEFLCEGSFIEPSKIITIQIYETEKSFRDLQLAS